MKRMVAMYVGVVMMAAGLSAQQPNPKGKQERVEALKIAFITERLKLTPEEAKVFWPVYNKYTEELKKLRESTKGKLAEEFGELPNMSDAEAEKMLNEMVSYKVAEAELIKKYAGEFKKVLPVKKVILLFKAENDFKRRVIEELMNRRGGGGRRGPGGEE